MIEPPPLPREPIIVASPPLVVKTRFAAERNFSRKQRLVTQGIVLHSTEGHTGTTQDDNVAAMFASPSLEPPRSAHYVVDADSATRCVPDMLTAWHCGHTGNAGLIGVELCGTAAQTRAQWLAGDAFATLCNAARLVATLCSTHRIPPMVVNDRGLVSGARGITTHAYVSKAWHETTHTDPGDAFPLAAFVVAVARALDVVADRNA